MQLAKEFKKDMSLAELEKYYSDDNYRTMLY